jgi:acid phosphatase class B
MILRDEADGGDEALTDAEDGAPYRIPEGELEGIMSFVAGGVDDFVKKGGDPKFGNAFARSQLTNDEETGTTRKATSEEFKNTLKTGGIPTGFSGEPVAAGVYLSQIPQKIGDYAVDAVKNKGIKGVSVDAATGVAGGVAGAAKTIFENSPVAKGYEFLTSETAASIWGGTNRTPPITVSKNGEIKASPGKLDPKNDAESVKKLKEELDKTSQPVMMSKELMAVHQLQGAGDKLAAINAKYRGKKAQFAATSELYLAGGLTKEEYTNASETGDFRYSNKDLAEIGSKLQKTDLEMQNLQARTDKTLQEIAVVQNEKLSSGARTAAKNELVQDALKNYEGVISDVAVSFAGGKSEYNKPVKAKLMNALRTTLAAKDFDVVQLGTLGMQVTIQDAANSYLRSNGHMNGDSFTSYLNTASGKLRDGEDSSPQEQAADNIRSISSTFNVSETLVTNKLNEAFNQYRGGAGKEMSADMQVKLTQIVYDDIRASQQKEK